MDISTINNALRRNTESSITEVCNYFFGQLKWYLQKKYKISVQEAEQFAQEALAKIFTSEEIKKMNSKASANFTTT